MRVIIFLGAVFGAAVVYGQEQKELKVSEPVLDEVCGTVVPQPKPLVSFGAAAKHGEIPWHAAVYNLNEQGSLRFFCGATLISLTDVITAARCITLSGVVKPFAPENLIVYLGKHQVKNFTTPDTQLKEVQETFVHPDFELQKFSNDLAIIKLTSPIKVTDYVRPICLWRDAAEFSNIENKFGKVAGWGLNEKGLRVETLSYVSMAVVSNDVCLESIPGVYKRFTNDNTFCAGNKNGSAICNTDAGGGMVFPIASSDAQHPRWQIRAVAGFVPSLENGRCDSDNYAVFYDLTKYTDWVKKILQLK